MNLTLKMSDGAHCDIRGNSPVLTLGVADEWRITLLDIEGNPIPREQLEQCTYWRLLMTESYDRSVPPLVRFTEDIGIDDASGELIVTIPSINTAGMLEYLGDIERRNVGVEIAGYAEEGLFDALICVQFDIAVRNRRNMVGEVVTMSPENYRGPQGAPGEKGEKGDKGDKGERGDKGEAGTTDYNKLLNKPIIPTTTSQLTNNSDFTTNSLVETRHSTAMTAINQLSAQLDTKGEVKSVNGYTPDTTGEVTFPMNGGRYVWYQKYFEPQPRIILPWSPETPYSDYLLWTDLIGRDCTNQFVFDTIQLREAPVGSLFRVTLPLLRDENLTPQPVYHYRLSNSNNPTIIHITGDFYILVEVGSPTVNLTYAFPARH